MPTLTPASWAAMAMPEPENQISLMNGNETKKAALDWAASFFLPLIVKEVELS